MSKPEHMLQTEVAGIRMKNPVMAASGTFGFGVEYREFLDLNQIGAIVVKGTTLKPRAGNCGRRIAETPAGMLNAIGLENPGVEALIDNILPTLREYDVPVLVNISGNTVEEYGELAKRLDKTGIAGIEINISCPNVKEGGIAFGTNCDSAASVVKTVKANTALPVITKLSPNVTDIVAMALAVEAAGSDAISLINTLLGMAVDIHSWRPVLGNVVGGLSGPAVKPVALRMVWQVCQAVKIPVIGMGGIMTAEDAIEFMLVGASAVMVGTANFVDPQTIEKVVTGLEEYVVKRDLSCIQDVVGKLKVN